MFSLNFLNMCFMFIVTLTRGKQLHNIILSVAKFTANLYCICLSINFQYTQADAVQICADFWDTQYVS